MTEHLLSGTRDLLGCTVRCVAGLLRRPTAELCSSSRQPFFFGSRFVVQRAVHKKAGVGSAGSGRTGSADRIHLKDASSQRWLARQMRDPYVKRARLESWRCRSAFKLLEIDDRFRLLAAGATVIDCGAAPGSWSQVAVQRVNALGQDEHKPRGTVISIDRDYFLPVEGAVTFRNADITSPAVQADVLRLIACSSSSSSCDVDFSSSSCDENVTEPPTRRVDVLLSDMAPNASGHPSLDHERIVELAECALTFGEPLLRSGGTFLCKLWQGYLLQRTRDRLLSTFETVRTLKPQASRDDSAELFLLACGYRVGS